MELVFLVDASGSMGYSSCVLPADNFKGLGMSSLSLYDAVLAVGHKLHDALLSVHSPHAVYIHTSINGDRPNIAKVVSYKMKTKDQIGNRFWEMASKISKNNNFDGVAIETVIDLAFTKKRNDKVLFVLSDGIPSGTGYGGTNAIDHTIKTISNARKNGIMVIAISLIPNVYENNDKLYGEGNNIKVGDDIDKGLSSELKKVFGIN